MSSFICSIGSFKSSRTSTNDKHLFLFCSFFNRTGLYIRIDGTLNRLTEHNRCQTSATANTWSDIFTSAFFCFIGKIRITDIGSADHNCIHSVIFNQFIGNPWFIDSRYCCDRNMNILSDFFSCLQMRSCRSTRSRHGRTTLDCITTRNMNEINASLFQLFGYINLIIDCQTTSTVFIT